jgi:hypothetical protein
MKDAVEMAVLSSVQHPNIVTVYSCLTDMVETAGEGGSLRPCCLRPHAVHCMDLPADLSSALCPLACIFRLALPLIYTPSCTSTAFLADGNGSRSVGASGDLRTHYRRLTADEDSEGETATFSLIVMEVRRLAWCPNNWLGMCTRALHRPQHGPNMLATAPRPV